MHEKEKNQSSLSWIISCFLGVIVGSLIVNLILGKEILHDIDQYSLKKICLQENKTKSYELFTFIMLKRIGLLMLYFLTLYILPKRIVKQIVCFLLSLMAGMLISSQVICDGMAAIYEMGLFLFPHVFFYLFAMFIGMNKYLLKSYGKMFLLVILFFVTGILMESFVNPYVIRLMY